MNPVQPIIEIIAELIIAASALRFIKNHPVGVRRLGAFLAFGVMVVSMAWNLVGMFTPVPDTMLIEEMLHLLIIWFLFQAGARLYPDKDDVENVLYVFQKSIDIMRDKRNELAEINVE